MLSDRDIKAQIDAGRIIIKPLREDRIQPASVDLTLDNRFGVFPNTRRHSIIATDPPEDLTERVVVPEGENFILHPGEFVLASTVEKITLPDDIAARLEGKSSMGRIGLTIHSTAGFIDPGWKGDLTLELHNVARIPIALTPGMKIGQISFTPLTSPCERPYGSPGLGSRYQGQSGPTPARPQSQDSHELAGENPLD